MLFLLLAFLEKCIYLFCWGASLARIWGGSFFIVVLIIEGYRGNFKGIGMYNNLVFYLFVVVRDISNLFFF